MNHSIFFEPSWSKYLGLAGVCVVFSIFAHWWMMGLSLLLSTMFWSLVFITPLIFDFAPRLLDHFRHKAMADLQGVYHTFEGQMVRVLYADGLVWLATRDVYKALGVKLGKEDERRLALSKRHRTIPGTSLLGVSEEHVSKAVSLTRAPEADRFNLWFEREVLFPIRNRANKGIPVAEAVIPEAVRA